jgi:hypothetical protein
MLSLNVMPSHAPSMTCSHSTSHVVPKSWVTIEAQPVPAWMLDVQTAGDALSTLGKAIGPGILDAAKKMGCNCRQNSKGRMRSSPLNSSSRS